MEKYYHVFLYIAANEMVKNNQFMTALQKYTLEFHINASPKLLYTLISTAEGLARWFADRVVVKGEIFHFYWEGSTQTARIVDSKEFEMVQFEWTDDYHEGFSMEMHILHEPVSGESALIISDHSEYSDMEFSKLWWAGQVARLQRLFNQ